MKLLPKNHPLPPNHPLNHGAVICFVSKPREPAPKPAEPTPKPSAPNSDSEQPQNGEA